MGEESSCRTLPLLLDFTDTASMKAFTNAASWSWSGSVETSKQEPEPQHNLPDDVGIHEGVLPPSIPQASPSIRHLSQRPEDLSCLTGAE